MTLARAFGEKRRAPSYFEYVSGAEHRFVPRETDVIEFDQPISAGIEVREFASLGDFLREAQPPRGE